MRKKMVNDLCLELGVKVFDLYKGLVFKEQEFVISKRILKSGIETCSLLRNKEIEEAYKMAVVSDFWLKMLVNQSFNFKQEQNKKIRDLGEQLRYVMRILELSC